MSFTAVVTLALALAIGQSSAITGVVLDETGLGIPGATVIVRSARGTDEQTITGPAGRFTLVKRPAADATIIVRAGGFAEKRLAVNGDHMEIVVSAAPLFETVTVTPSRSEERTANIPASISVLHADV